VKGSGQRPPKFVLRAWGILIFFFTVLNTNKMTGFVNNLVFFTSYAPWNSCHSALWSFNRNLDEVQWPKLRNPLYEKLVFTWRLLSSGVWHRAGWSEFINISMEPSISIFGIKEWAEDAVRNHSCDSLKSFLICTWWCEGLFIM